MKNVLSRRTVLRGTLAGGAVSIGLPILNSMLNENGDAFAATGKPLPTRFATWFWPLGLGEQDWTPKSKGADYELPSQMAVLKPFQKRLNFYTGNQVFLDGHANVVHFTTVQALMTGKVTGDRQYFGSVDSLIADTIGKGTRFQSLIACCSGDPKVTWSARSDSGFQAPEISPYALYLKIFGPEFVDPNAATFTPDPDVVLRRSVLSAISDDRQAIMKKVGAEDKAKLDSYFTSLRSLEQRLDIQLQKPEPMPSCSKPAAMAKPIDTAPDGGPLTLAEEAMKRHDVFTQLFMHALACDQTRVVNLLIAEPMSQLRRIADPTSHHTHTHEEHIDEATGVQPNCNWFQQAYMKGLHDFAAAMDSIKEGDKTMLDRMVIFAYTDHGKPRIHSALDMPVITIGNGDGRMKTGMHINRPGDTVCRVSFSVLQAMGVSGGAWATGSNKVNTPISEVLA
jgi:hypothetical protein